MTVKHPRIDIQIQSVDRSEASLVKFSNPSTASNVTESPVQRNSKLADVLGGVQPDICGFWFLLGHNESRFNSNDGDGNNDGLWD